jgi:hypothetical protein
MLSVAFLVGDVKPFNDNPCCLAAIVGDWSGREINCAETIDTLNNGFIPNRLSVCSTMYCLLHPVMNGL